VLREIDIRKVVEITLHGVSKYGIYIGLTKDNREMLLLPSVAGADN